MQFHKQMQKWLCIFYGLKRIKKGNNKMNVKEMLYKVLTNLRGLEVKGEDNVLILAQTFLDINNLLQYCGNKEKNKESTDNQ